MNVVDAARCRIRNVFSNGVKVYMSFSAGKDSLCMSYIVYDMILHGQINPEQLTVVFIDEEAIYKSMEAMALRWRKRFMSVGAEFRWYCLPLKQVSAFHQLQNDERWVTWEPGKENEWVRQPPPFAIQRSPYLDYPGEMNYQTFLPMITRDGIQIIGVRASESIQRTKFLSKISLTKDSITGKNAIYPIYDWKDSDVWMFIRENNLDFPEAYIDLYRVGTSKNRLRLSNFFGADSCAGLRHIIETDPDLWTQIEKREPNAYLAMLYWDSEMFKRNSRKRQQLEGNSGKDYKELCRQMLFVDPGRYFTNDGTRKTADMYRKFFIKYSQMMEPEHYRRMHDALVGGDPKLRSLRALYSNVFDAYAAYSRESSPFQKGVNR